jgi:hypothetical protein
MLQATRVPELRPDDQARPDTEPMALIEQALSTLPGGTSGRERDARRPAKLRLSSGDETGLGGLGRGECRVSSRPDARRRPDSNLSQADVGSRS